MRSFYSLGGTMMVAWEIGERAIGVRESRSNQAIDIAIGLAGVWLALTLASHLERRTTICSWA